MIALVEYILANLVYILIALYGIFCIPIIFKYIPVVVLSGSMETEIYAGDLAVVKEIDTDETVTVTLSIAISNEGETSLEKYKSAQAAMDLVLGRGGDQAVTRENDKYTFFGGKTLEVEKRTRVKARTVARALEQLIEETENRIECDIILVTINQRVENLDEDDMVRFLQGNTAECPFYQSNDEYKIVRKQM